MLPEGYVENYEQIAKDFNQTISTETMEISGLINYSFRLMGFVIGTSILDVGCGSAYALRSLWSWKCVGLDISHFQCESAFRSPQKINTVQADAQQMPFQDKNFQAVICTDLFEHVPDEKKLADEIHRVLCDNGILFFACPLGQDLSYYDSSDYDKKYKYVHLRSVSRELLNNRFSKFRRLSEVVLRSHMAIQPSPYPIVFQVYVKRSIENAYRHRPGLCNF